MGTTMAPQGDTSAVQTLPQPDDPKALDKLAVVPVESRYDLQNEEVLKVLKTKFDDRIRLGQQERQRFEREWFRNILFYAGRHYEIWDRTRNRFRAKDLPAWWPKVVGNRLAKIWNDLVNVLVRGGRVSINYMPATDDFVDISVADMAESIRETLYAESDPENTVPEELANWIVGTGNGFLIPYYDHSDKYGTVSLSLFTCPQCGEDFRPVEAKAAGMRCPNCGAANAAPIAAESAEIASPDTGAPGSSTEDETGAVAPSQEGETAPPPVAAPVPAPNLEDRGHTEQIPIGRFSTVVCSPFEILGDQRIRNKRDWTWFIRQHIRDAEDQRNEYGVAVPPSPDKEMSLSQMFLDAMAFVTSASSSAFYDTTSLGRRGGEKALRSSEYHYYELPTPEFPKGVKAIRVGKSGPFVKFGPLPDTYGAGPRKGQPFLPLVHFGFDRQVGRFWRKTRIVDLISLQSFANLLMSMIRLTASRTGNSAWLNPTGSGVDQFTGDPGAIIPYTPVSLGGTTFAKPERIPAELSGVQSLIIMVNKVEEEMESIAGTQYLAGGDTPPGVVAACMDEETECLSKRGWLRHSELTDDDEIYTFDAKTERGVWCKPQKINRYQYRGEILVGENVHLSTVMTPNHRWCVGSLNDGVSREFAAKKRDRVHPNRKRRRPYNLKPIDKFRFVSAASLKRHQYILSGAALGEEKQPLYSDAEVRVFGWIFTEGSYSQRTRWVSPEYTVEIAQSSISSVEECALIRVALGEAGIRWSESSDKRTGVMRFRISGIKARELQKLFPEKIPTLEFLHSLNAHQAKILVDTMLLGDGSESFHRHGTPHHARVYNTTNFRLAELFQFVATLAGYPTSQVKPYYHGEVNHKKPEYSDYGYRVTVKKTPRYKMRTFVPTIERQNFSGTVWCPTTDTGTWFARRSGKVFITGNSALSFIAERADQSVSPLKRSWTQGWAEWESLGLEIFRANATDQRVTMIAGRNRKWQAHKFSSEDLQGAVRMLVDDRSLIPKSHATQRAILTQLVQLGIVNPQDPEQKYKLLQKFGEGDILGSSTADADEAQKEWEDFLNGQIPHLIPLVQNSQAHILYHAEAAKTDEFRELPPGNPGDPANPIPCQQAWIDHIQLHYQDLMARQAAFTPPPVAGGGQGAAGPIGSHDTSGRQASSGGGNGPSVESSASDPSARRSGVGGHGAGGGEIP